MLLGSTMARTNARLSAVSVRMVSVRPFLKRRVRLVSYVAVKLPRVRYHASCIAIWMNASGDRRATRERDVSWAIYNDDRVHEGGESALGAEANAPCSLIQSVP